MPSPSPSEHDPERDARSAAEFLQQHQARVVRVEVPDVDGVLRGKRFSAERFLQGVRAGGIPWSQAIFCWDVAGHVLRPLQSEEWQSGFFGDVVVVPDTSTLAPVPWEPGTVAVLADAVDARGREVAVAPRNALRRLDEALAERGFQVRAALEIEFVLLRESPESARAKLHVGLQPADPGDLAYSLLRSTEMLPMLDELQDLCGQAGLDVDVVHTEPGPGMVEANLRHRPLVEAADRAIRFKLAAKQIARRHGLLATFMAQRADGVSGCGGHVHQSLWSLDGTSAFADASGRWRPAFHQYLGGQLETMADLCALFNPTVNSYRRVASTSAAPRNASWGEQNRLAAIRAIPGDPSVARLEHRRSGADCNPYLAVAGCVVGGLHGLDAEVVPWPAVEGNAYEAGPDVARPLPSTLRAAAGLFRESLVARKYLGDEFVDHFAFTRDWEADQFDTAVTDWEVRRYLEQI
jgi:glutamine synthetase